MTLIQSEIESPIPESFLRDFLRKYDRIYLDRRVQLSTDVVRISPRIGAVVAFSVFAIPAASFLAIPLLFLPYASITVSAPFGLAVLVAIALYRRESIELRVNDIEMPRRKTGQLQISATHVDAVELVHNRGSLRAQTPDHDSDDPPSPALQIWIRMGEQHDPILARHAVYERSNWERLKRRCSRILNDQFVGGLCIEARSIAEWFDVPLIVDTKLDSENGTWWPHDGPIPGTSEPSTIQIYVGQVNRPRTSNS